MRHEDQSAGAKPVEESATLSQSYPSGPGFAAYRLPIPGINGMIRARDVGVMFDGEPAGGAQPPAGDPPPAADPPADPAPPATGDPEALGDPGKRALEAERTARREAEQQAKEATKALEKIKLEHASEGERAIAEAKQAGADEVIGRVHATVRKAAVREALTAAGALPSLISDLAKADEFASLKVNDDDEVDPKELADAMKAHKARVPDAYKVAAAAGSADGGSRSGGGQDPAKDLTTAIERHYAPQG